MNVSLVIESTFALAFIPGGWEMLAVAGIALILFGNRVPGAAKSLGMSFSAFKKGIKEGEDDLDKHDQSSSSQGVENKSPPEQVESQP